MIARRSFITLLGGAPAVWPVVARGQQAEGVRRIGILHDYAETDPEGQIQIAAFRDELSQLGWKEGRNLTIDLRSGADEADALRASARELLAKSPNAWPAVATGRAGGHCRISKSLSVRRCL